MCVHRKGVDIPVKLYIKYEQLLKIILIILSPREALSSTNHAKSHLLKFVTFKIKITLR